MKRLDVTHHKIITFVIILLVFLTGLFFGVKISGATRGTDSMNVMIFALCFLGVAMSFLNFSQLAHLRDENAGKSDDYVNKSPSGRNQKKN